jgi:hypothetical protein
LWRDGSFVLRSSLAAIEVDFANGVCVEELDVERRRRRGGQGIEMLRSICQDYRCGPPDDLVKIQRAVQEGTCPKTKSGIPFIGREELV